MTATITRADIMRYTCPQCSATPGQACQRRSGKPNKDRDGIPRNHFARMQAAQTSARPAGPGTVRAGTTYTCAYCWQPVVKGDRAFVTEGIACHPDCAPKAGLVPSGQYQRDTTATLF